MRLVAGAVLALARVASAQNGDVRGETQPPLPPDLVVPPAPERTPASEAATFRIEPGYRVELVASEPLVADPVHMAFDAAGRLFVVEMRGFMPDVDGRRERAPVGRVVRLEDTDGDGRMDTSTVFADRLVLPRAVMPTYEGALVIAPPDLVYYRDRDDDGIAERGTVLRGGFGGLDSPEHAGNGLLPGLDNWIHLSQHRERLRFDGTTIQAQATPGHGQWGIARDAVGRLYYTTNSDPLRGDAWPLHYASRHPRLRRVVGINERFAHDMRVWPIRITPGVNRGYRRGTLREDFTLARFTAACAPLIVGPHAFVCEPSGNLVKRYRLVEGEAWPRAELVAEGREFLASTDERFRPVALAVGPDDAMYVADFYRGILQHRIFMTTFLRQQVEERGLAAPIGLGRIWRVVPADHQPRPVVDLRTWTDPELVAALADDGPWRRSTAQRLLVERRAADVAEDLRRLLHSADTDGVTRLHALWTLEGIGAIDRGDAIEALADADPFVRAAAVRLLEPWLDDPAVIRALEPVVNDEAVGVRVQLALSLGESSSDAAFDLLARLVTRHAGDERVRTAAASGLAGRELALAARLLSEPDWTSDAPGRSAVLDLLTVLALGASPDERTQLLEIALRSRPWQREAILGAVTREQRIATQRPRRLELAREPAGWSVMRAEPGDAATAMRAIDAHLAWPGRDGMRPGPRPLEGTELARFHRGSSLYLVACAACHRADGRGARGAAPALAGSEIVLGDADVPARIMLHGLTGPLEVDGEAWNLTMPPATVRGDAGIAAVLTYVRRAWGNDADPVSAEDVAQVRRDHRDHPGPWTAAELGLAVPR